jgi:hypothetical protein
MNDNYVLSLTVREFRAMKKATRALINTGMDFDSAASFLVVAHRERKNRYHETRDVLPVCVYKTS